MANVKAIYLDSNGVYRPAGSADTIDVGNIKLLNQTTANGVLSTDASGNVSSALLSNQNVASDAGISGTKIDPNFGSQNIQTSGTISGNLSADDLTSGTVPSARVSGSYTGITGVGTLTSGTWNASAISDTYLSQITTANKVANSATSANSGNEPNKIVLRDGSGNFSAGMITANLTGAVTGNASTASAWQTSREVSFSGGDVTGSFSIDGSQNVSSVALTIGSDKIATGMIQNSAVTNDKLAGSISNDKLNTLTAAGLVSDSALSNNVALYNAAAPVFANKLGVAPVTSADVTKAADVQFVLDQVAAATAGLDYKQEAQWYLEIDAQQTIADVVALINSAGANSPVVAGDRILFNDESAANTAAGIYKVSGTPGSYTVARASDMASGSTATGAWVYCLQTIGGNPPAPVNLGAAYVCNTAAATTGTTAIQFVLYAAGQTYTASSPLLMTGTDVSLVKDGSLTVVANALSIATTDNGSALAKDSSSKILKVRVDASTVSINGSNNLNVLGVPSTFTIAGSATSGNVTAANLNTVTAGGNSDASSLHAHSIVQKAFARSGAAINDGLAVWFNGTTVAKTSSSGANGGRVTGIVVQDLGTSECYVAVSGVAKITNLYGSAVAGDNLYLYSDGRLCGFSDIPAGDFATKVGRYLGGIGPSGADMISISIQEFGIKPSVS